MATLGRSTSGATQELKELAEIVHSGAENTLKKAQRELADHYKSQNDENLDEIARLNEKLHELETRTKCSATSSCTYSFACLRADRTQQAWLPTYKSPVHLSQRL